MITHILSRTCRTVLRLSLGLLLAQPALADSLALFYGQNPPLAELRAFDHVVLEPGHVPQAPAANGATHWYAYVSVGEVHPQRSYRSRIPANWIIGRNAAWGADIVDQTQPDWPRFFIDEVVTPLWQRGYRGLFLDTLDSYQLAATTAAARQQQEQGLARLIQSIRQRYPELRLIANRGFEILPQAAGQIDMVVAESLYQGWDAANQRYRSVTPADQAWLRDRLKQVQDLYHKPVAVIDYVDPAQRELARETARKISADGFIPWVGTPGLDSIGIGNVEVQPRKVMVFYDSGESPDLMRSLVARYLAMPLQYLGLVPEYHDLQQPAPEMTLAGRYAGIIVWSRSGQAARLESWLQRQMRQGIKVALLGELASGDSPASLQAWGLQTGAAVDRNGRIDILRQNPALGLEAPPLPQARLLQPVRLSAATGNEAWLTLQQNGSPIADAVAITGWGGYALAPFTLIELPNERQRWVLDPFRFLQAALRLPPMPAPDVTTDNGRRSLLIHVDGDGFASRAEIPGTPFAGEAMLNQVLRKYRLPSTISIIEGETAGNGLFAPLSPILEPIARRIFAEPYVEIASHSYSHPFKWQKLSSGDESGEGNNLAIRNYQFSLEREIGGSVDYIDRKLAPAGKQTRVFLWTGDCNPGDAALQQTAQRGLLNMNGGETIMTRSNPTLTGVAPLGIPKGDQFQVFAPNQNENVYTNNWTGPFYGFERVIETFELTDKPRRLKPINIYYHTYAASKLASLKALHKVYDWALAQAPHPVYASDYIQRVLDFNALSIARSDAGWQIRGADRLRELRIDAAQGYPDLRNSRNVIGYRRNGNDLYIHLGQAEALLVLQSSPPHEPYLVDANAKLPGWRYTASGFETAIKGEVALEFSLANTQDCRIHADNTLLKPLRVANGISHFKLASNAVTSLRAECKR